MPTTRVPVQHKTGGLTHKLGPLPVWGWGVVLLTGLALGMYLRHRMQGGGSVAVSPVTPAGDSGGIPSGAVGGSQQPSPSGLSPDIESLLMGQQATQQTLLDAFQGTLGSVVGLAESARASSVAMNQQAFDFASNVFATQEAASAANMASSFGFANSVFGSALDFAKSIAPIAPATPVPAQVIYVQPQSAKATDTPQPSHNASPGPSFGSNAGTGTAYTPTASNPAPGPGHPNPPTPAQAPAPPTVQRIGGRTVTVTHGGGLGGFKT